MYEEKRRPKSKFSCKIFLKLRKVIGTLGITFAIHYQRAFVCEGFASFYCGYHRAAPIPHIQNTILNPPAPNVRCTTILIDSCGKVV